jgi:two-component system chemotaxis sensor kinase CheA
VEDLKGSIRIETEVGKGSRFLLDLPLTLSTAQVLMVEVSGQILAIPIGYVEETLLLDPADVFREGGHPVFRLRDRTISIYQMSQFLGGLESRASARHHQFLAVVILQGRGQRVGFQVARFLEQSEVVVKTLGSFIDSVAFISGATILGDGKPSLILDVPDLLSSLALQRTASTLRVGGSSVSNRGASKVLVVDDSITTRALQKGILESEGYEVHTAAGAKDALRILEEERFDLLLTDVEMPEMDGFQLTEKVRANPELAKLPIIICSVKGSEDDRLKGMRLGAQAYLVKREFDQDEFCSVVRQLIR